MAIESQGTVLEIETGDAVAKDITDVTLGAVTEVTSVAHGMSVGDVGTFAAVTGTTELNGQTAMVVAVETDSFFVMIDSSGYSAYVSAGTFTPAAYTEIGEVIDWDGPGGSASVIDVTHLQSTAKEKLIGLMDEGQLTLTVNLDLDDTGQLAAQAARTSREKLGFRLTYSDANVQTWDGYVLGFSSSGSVDDKVQASITIEISGAVSTA